MKRKIQVLRDNKWTPCEMKELRGGETFKMYEEDKEIDFMGTTTFLAGADARLRKDGQWVIEIIDPSSIK
jgi:hypothetical protein